MGRPVPHPRMRPSHTTWSGEDEEAQSWKWKDRASLTWPRRSPASSPLGPEDDDPPPCYLVGGSSPLHDPTAGGADLRKKERITT